jgi:formylmethanofuran dehydrogenase subunit E
MGEEETKWEQPFYDEVRPIKLREPLAEFLGAVGKNGHFIFSYTDAVKMAGHSCPSVAGAYKITQKALETLYPDEIPVRGDISVEILGAIHHGANGPISQVITLITGAATKTGFSGLGLKFARKGKLVFNDEDEEPNAFIFTRDDTGRSVKIKYHPERLPPDGDLSNLYTKCISETASKRQREKFKKIWQKRVEAVLFEEVEGLFDIEEIKKPLR